MRKIRKRVAARACKERGKKKSRILEIHEKKESCKKSMQKQKRETRTEVIPEHFHSSFERDVLISTCFESDAGLLLSDSVWSPSLLCAPSAAKMLWRGDASCVCDAVAQCETCKWLLLLSHHSCSRATTTTVVGLAHRAAVIHDELGSRSGGEKRKGSTDSTQWMTPTSRSRCNRCCTS